MVKRLLFPVYICLVCHAVSAQTSATSDSFASTAENNAIHYYYQFIDKQSRLYNGADHMGYSSRIKGHAYFETRELRIGTVDYDGLEFSNVPMVFDLLKDQLVILHFNKLTKLSLVNEKVKDFTINNHHFIRIVKDSLHNQTLTTGFYDEVYNGKSAVLVRRSKFIEETVTDHLEQNFAELNFFYVKKEGTWKTVKTYKGLLGLFTTNARDVRRYLKKSKIKFRKDRETAIVKAAAYYDTLNN
jgi:hypothetical protein